MLGGNGAGKTSLLEAVYVLATTRSFRTSQIGDCARPPLLAHKAMHEGNKVVELIAGVGHGTVDYNNIPNVTYCHPEVASVGLTEEKAREQGYDISVGVFPFSANGRARCMDEIEGLVKIIADAATDRVLAVHIFGPGASDLIAECVTIMEFAGSAEDIARCTHAHPTLSEAVGEAARMAWAGKPLNS